MKNYISLLPHVSKHSAQLHVSSVEAEISRFHSNQDKQFVHFTLSGEPLQSTSEYKEKTIKELVVHRKFPIYSLVSSLRLKPTEREIHPDNLFLPSVVSPEHLWW
jgi:hypothetical protein